MITYVGYVMEIGAPEKGKSGKEKPRKVVVSNRPGEYQGKTFRCWGNTDDFQAFRRAADGNLQVEIAYEVQQIPNTTYTQNMVSSVLVNGEVPVSGDTANVEIVADSATVTSSASAPSPSPQDMRSYELESAWAIGQVLHRAAGEIDAEQLVEKSLWLIALKRRVRDQQRSLDQQP